MKRTCVIITFAVLFICNLSGQDTDCTSAGCHDNMLKSSHIHPVLEDGCDSCHEPNDNQHPTTEGKEFSLTDPVPDLCFACHDGAEEAKLVHVPFEEGECLTCHSPHGSDREKLLIYSEENPVCADCHDFDETIHRVNHAPFENKECMECHLPHYGDNRSLLKKDTPELCFICHDDVQEQTGLSSVHPPLEDDCLTCHFTHNGDNEKNLVENTPGLCYQCHDDIESDAEQAVTVHAPLNEDGNCLQCHLPHASENYNLLTSSSETTCLQCHGIEKNRKIKPEHFKYPHEAVLDGGCISCHLPHSANEHHLLQAKFPQGHYTKMDEDNFSLCFECHDPDIINLKETEDATEFRNGSVNLHYIHINRDKSRNCTNCHEIHASTQPRLIKSQLKFGKWSMKIEFRADDAGGSCRSACHKVMKYKR